MKYVHSWAGALIAGLVAFPVPQPIVTVPLPGLIAAAFRLQLSPAIAVPGMTIFAEDRGVPTSGTCSFSIDDENDDPAAQACVLDGDGGLFGQFVVPELDPGQYTVSLSVVAPTGSFDTDLKAFSIGQPPGDANFVVPEPTIAAAPQAVNPSGTVQITGSGFSYDPFSGCTVTFDLTKTPCTVLPDGTLVAMQLTMPDSPLSVQTVTVTEAFSDAAPTANVTILAGPPPPATTITTVTTTPATTPVTTTPPTTPVSPPVTTSATATTRGPSRTGSTKPTKPTLSSKGVLPPPHRKPTRRPHTTPTRGHTTLASPAPTTPSASPTPFIPVPRSNNGPLLGLPPTPAMYAAAAGAAAIAFTAVGFIRVRRPRQRSPHHVRVDLRRLPRLPTRLAAARGSGTHTVHVRLRSMGSTTTQRPPRKEAP